MTSTPPPLPPILSFDEAVSTIRSRARDRRIVVGLAGSPGSGKSTVAEELVRTLGDAVLLPLDGYHLPQADLVRLGRRDRMGAPDTFDTAAFLRTLTATRDAEPGETVSARSFDRSREEPVMDGLALTLGERTVLVVEGNYLLSDSEGWGQVRGLLDLRLQLVVGSGERRRRLIARHLRFGKTLEEATAWADGPDQRNALSIEGDAHRADARLVLSAPRPLARILHLSDTHLLGDPAARYHGVVDPRAALEAVLDAHDRVPDLDPVVVSGDLSDDGSPESYRHLRERLDAWAGARGAQVVLALGNHDDRAGSAAAGTITGESVVGGLRILTLDTSVPGGHSWGLLTEPDLARLRAFAAAPGPFAVVLHHPPITPVTPLHHVMGLVNPHDFWSAVEGSDLRAVLSGHWHHAFVDTTGRAPVLVAPGVANRTDVLAGPDTERSVAASGGSIVEIMPTGVRVTAVEVPAPHRGEELFAVTGDRLAEGIRRLGFAQQHEDSRQEDSRQAGPR